MSNLLVLLNLQEDEYVTVEETKVCVSCKQIKPISHYPKRSATTYDTRCAVCKQSYAKELRKIKKDLNIPPMPTHCDCCGKENPKGKVIGATNLALDHHYDDEGNPFFRGWICVQCNSGIGYLGDNITGVSNAVFYLMNSLPPKQKFNFLKLMLNSLPEEERKLYVINTLQYDYGVKDE